MHPDGIHLTFSMFSYRNDKNGGGGGVEGKARCGIYAGLQVQG